MKRRRLRRVIARGAAVVFGVPLLYAAAAVGLALIPVNRGFVEPTEGIDVYLVSNGIHVDFLVPAKTSVFDWSEKLSRAEFPGAGTDWSHVLFGWGDRGIYLDTPTWADLKVSTAIGAVFWPTPSVVHAQYVEAPFEEDETCRRVRLGEDSFRKLCGYLEASFQKGPGGAFRLIPGRGYRDTDNFYEAEGSYHAFNTCNLWTNRGLARIGARTAFWSPFPFGILRHAPPR